MKNRNVFLFSLLFCSFTLSNFNYSNAQVQVQSENGLNQFTTEGPNGPVTFYLPKDLRYGEQISGSVYDHKGNKPKGTSIQGIVIEMNDQSVLDEDGISLSLPKKEERNTPLKVLNLDGDELASLPLEIQSQPRIPVRIIEFPDLIMPASGFSPLKGSCNCDGISSNSEALINDRPIEVLAETGGETFLEIPDDVSGKVQLSFTDNGQTYTDSIQVVRLNTEAGKTHLKKGEQTTGKITVSGLKGNSDKIYVSIVNTTPENVRISSGDQQLIPIDSPLDQDNWQFVFSIKAIRTGGFDIHVNLVPEEELEKEDSNDTEVELIETTSSVTTTPSEVLNSYEQVYSGFAEVAGINYTVTDINLPRKYKFHPDRVTRAGYSKKDVNARRKEAVKKSKEKNDNLTGTEVVNRKELKNTVGFRVYYTSKDKWNCYEIISEWFSGGTEEYYNNRYKINRELEDVISFKDIKATVKGDLEVSGTVSSGWSVSGSFSVGIPKVGSVGISITPPSTSKLSAKGTFAGDIAGYLNGKSLIIYVYKDTYRIEKGYHQYFFRYRQKYCNDQPVGSVTYESTSKEIWYQCDETTWYADTYIVTEGIPDDSGKPHIRKEQIGMDQFVTMDFSNCKEKEPGDNEDPSAFFDSVK